MEITGTLKVKFDTQKVSDQFSKREFVLTTEANTPYPQHVPMQVTNDKCWLLDALNPGDELKVDFNIRGREWNGPQGTKYFVTIDAWKLEKLANGTAQPAPAKVETNEGQGIVNNSADNSASDKEDLPF